MAEFYGEVEVVLMSWPGIDGGGGEGPHKVTHTRTRIQGQGYRSLQQKQTLVTAAAIVTYLCIA